MLVDYGMPPWLTYVLFAIITILLGALLGLILVSIIDLIFPPVSQNSRKSFAQENVAATDEDARDVIEDDQEAPSAAVPANDDEDGEAPSTSEGEKFSGSDSDESSINENDIEGTVQLEWYVFACFPFRFLLCVGFGFWNNICPIFHLSAVGNNEDGKKSQTSPTAVRKRKPRKVD